jgi:DNA-binding FadR family transcriptional regulator
MAEPLRSLEPPPLRRPPGAAVRVPKASEIIARLMRRDFVRQKLKPGDALPPEHQLQARFEVSRPTLREALRILEAQQLVRIVRGAAGGARYRLPDIDMVAEHTGIFLETRGATQADLTEARLQLEPAIVAFIAKDGAAEAIDALAQSVARHREVADDMAAFNAENQRFYDLLAAASPNQTLALFLLIFRDLIAWQSAALGGEPPFGARPSRKAVEAHIAAKDELIEHLRAHRAEAAAQLWTRHLAAQLKHLAKSGHGHRPITT